MAFMAWPQGNNTQYQNTTNTHLMNQHTCSLEHNIVTQNQSDYFTMLFIDVDDTLIPAKLHRYLFKHLGIDIFNLYKNTFIKQFQLDIIIAIQTIKQTFMQQYNEEIKIAIVSNASTKWLNLTINNTSENSYFKILSQYFINSNIIVRSAMDETYQFLCKKFGNKNKTKINEMIAMSLSNENNINNSKWMLKYTTYSSIINKYKRKLKKKCRQIINFGDGETEIEAIKNYAKTFDVDYMALKFVKYSTFNQLSYQWKYISENILSIISDMDINNIYNVQKMNLLQSTTTVTPNFNSIIIQNNSKNRYKHKRTKSNISDVSSVTTTESHKALNVFYFDYILKNDNNEYFTGNNQLNAIGIYFEKWINIHVLNQQLDTDKNAILKWMCIKIHTFMKGKNPYTHQMISFKTIIKNSLCKNKQFKYAFDNYYKQIKNNMNNKSKNKSNKRRKSIDESKISDDIPIKSVRNKNSIKDGSLSLMNVGKKYKSNSSVNTITTHVPSSKSNSSIKTSKSIESEEHNYGVYYSDDGEYLYFDQKSQYGDEENSSSPNI